MAHTHLHELLKEDQEPFELKNYIADRRSQLKLTAKTIANVTKRKPIIEPTTTSKFCINHHNVGFGLLGSFLKRLKHKSTRTKRHDISCLNNTKSSLPTKLFRGKVSLQKSPSLDHRTPDFLTSATSPSRRFRQEKQDYDIEQSKEINVEDEEQCSPVSVLDPPFEDDEHEYDVVEGDAYDLESSYATLQRTKHQLLQKLLKFERLVELDPIALEKHMAEECDDDEDDDYECVVPNVDVAVEEATCKEFFKGIIDHLGIENIPLHVERLVLDIISEENKNEEREGVVKRVCMRFDSWKLVESKTVDMMVEFELGNDKSEGWKRHDLEMAKEIVMNIEVAILGILVEEFAQELLDPCPCLGL